MGKRKQKKVYVDIKVDLPINAAHGRKTSMDHVNVDADNRTRSAQKQQLDKDLEDT